jgi:hypothetical protein
VKRAFIFFSVLLLSTVSYSQVFILGGNGIYNTTWMFNKFEGSPGMDRESVLSFGFGGGIDMKYYFNNSSYYSATFFAISCNPSFRSITQKFKGTITYNDSISNKSYGYTEEIKLSAIELPLMIHVQGEAGLYAELGASYGMIQTIKTSFSTEDTSFVSFSNADAKSAFNSYNISGIFGFGVVSKITTQIDLTTALRFTYGLIDLNKDFGIAATRTGTGGFILGVAYRFDSYHSHH